MSATSFAMRRVRLEDMVRDVVRSFEWSQIRQYSGAKLKIAVL